MNPNEIVFTNANSRETYYTMHNIKSAHQYSKGKGIRIGILDWLFACEKHTDFYTAEYERGM